jgi:hypothetical protein
MHDFFDTTARFVSTKMACCQIYNAGLCLQISDYLRVLISELRGVESQGSAAGRSSTQARCATSAPIAIRGKCALGNAPVESTAHCFALVRAGVVCIFCGSLKLLLCARSILEGCCAWLMAVRREAGIEPDRLSPDVCGRSTSLNLQ